MQWMVADKVATLPERMRDAIDKRTKDFLDLYGLVFHNLQCIHPRDLLAVSSSQSKARAAAHLPASRNWQPKYAEELDAIGDWLAADAK